MESSENSGVGGPTMNNASNASALRIGDTETDRQYKSIVSFDTSEILVSYKVHSARLELVHGDFSGTDPYLTHGNAWIDVSINSFGGNVALTGNDFQATADVSQAAQLTDNGTLATAELNNQALLAVPGTNTLQLRIAFDQDADNDNNDGYAAYYSGDNGNPSNHPRLVIEYTLGD